MENKKYWESLFCKLDGLTEDEFTDLANELDAAGDIPFAIEDCEVTIIDIDCVGTYSAVYCYNNKSQYKLDKDDFTYNEAA